MSLTPWQPTVRRIKDGETVEQTTVNTPIDQLTQRDQHLYEKFEEISGKSALISFGQPIHPDESFLSGELAIVYFKSENDSSGVARGITGFASSSSTSLFSPKNSNYSFGITKTIYSDTVDLYTEGLCEFSVDMDDAVLGIIQSQGTGIEPFAIGPYYLSSKQPGKITKDPSGIPVYVGYAVSKRQFLLHTNVDEFSQFFINHRYHILDRVAGVPENSEGVWSITSPDTTKLGWISASSANTVIPEGAKFFYNIPVAEIDGDTELTTAQKEEAKELAKYLPPVPANFIQLFVDGVLARYRDAYDTAGIYSVNEYGLWWCSETQPPWAEDYPTGQKKIFTSFSKFNPALRTQLVSSIKPFNTLTNKSSNFISFYGADNVSQKSYTGDLLVDIDPKFTQVGAASTFTSPIAILSNYTAGQAVAAIDFDKSLGTFRTTISPSVAKLQGAGDIVTSDLGSGVWQVSYRDQGTTGQVDSIEPVNARLEFLGLTSYIKLPIVSNTEYGLIGKIVLPKGYPSKDLKLVFHVFGDRSLEPGDPDRLVALKFEYAGVSAINGDSPTASNIVDASKYSPSTNPVELSLCTDGEAYTANTSRKISHVDLSIPAAYVGADSVISFKIIRKSPTTSGYAGNLGILGIYWEIS